MSNIDLNTVYKSNFIDSQEINWNIDMWTIKGTKEIFLYLYSYSLSRRATLEFLNLTELIITLNSVDYLPQDLKQFCIKIYKNRAFL